MNGDKLKMSEVRKNEQLIVDPINGDCFRACLTSILGMPNTEELPNAGDAEWFSKVSNFLNGLGMSIHYEEEAFWRSGYWIASVKSLNFPDVRHAIIMYCQEVYFDPSPKDKYLSGNNLLGKDVVYGGWYLEVENFSKLSKAIFDLDQREIDVEALAKIIYTYEWNPKGDSIPWEKMPLLAKYSYIKHAQHLADNMKMWIRRKQ